LATQADWFSDEESGPFSGSRRVDAIVTDAVVAVLCHLLDDLIIQFWLEPQALTGDHAETNLPQVLNLRRKPVEVMLQEPRLGPVAVRTESLAIARIKVAVLQQIGIDVGHVITVALFLELSQSGRVSASRVGTPACFIELDHPTELVLGNKTRLPFASP